MRNGGFWRYENRVIAVLSLMFGFVFFDRNAMTNLSTFVQADLHLSFGQIGMLASGLSLAWSISGFAVGTLSDSIGRRKQLLLIAVVIFSCCSVISGLAASFAVLIASRMIMGLAEGPIMPISQTLVVLETSPQRRGLAMGIMQNFGSNLIGSALAPVVLVTIAQMYNWRSAFYIAAIPGLICAILIWKLIREPTPEEVARVLGKPEKTGLLAGFAELLTHRNIWLCMIISCLMVPWMIIGWTFLPSLYVKMRMFSESEMKWLMAVLGISAAVFAFIVPGLSDKIGRKPVMIVFTLIGVFYPLVALYFSGPALALAALIFVGWSASGTFPLFMATIPAESASGRYIATALGLVNGIGEFLGGSTLPTFAGKAADHYGLQAPMFIAAGLALVATVFALFLKETAPVRVGTAAVAHA